MGTEVSGIAKTILQMRTNLKADASGKEAEQEIGVSFMELMNQNNLPNANISSGIKELSLRADVKGMANTAYDSYAAPTKSVSVKEGVTPEEMKAQAAEPLEAYEEEVRNVLKEELGVTDEEISAAMENLGMSFLDVRSLQGLTALVQELTGEDVGTLFLSEAFQNVVEQVSNLTETLCAELGISKEDLDMLANAWEQMEAVESPKNNLVTETDVKEPQAPVTQQKEQVSAEAAREAVPKAQVEVVVQKDDTSLAKEPTEALEETKTTDQMTVAAKEEAENGSEEKSSMEQSKDKGWDMTNTDTVFVGTEQQTTVRTEEFILPQEAPQPYAAQADAIDLIDQIARNVRVTISTTTTSMEMQLNPENLGRIYLNVSERDGVVRAQLATQNQVVKEALETQLVELRQSLNQQGIKVDAIEVTVGTHEFEQNLEENAKHEEQMQQQMEESQKQTRRNLNLNELDGLSGLMSEEEQLAAQIMRDNGNQVDLTA